MNKISQFMKKSVKVRKYTNVTDAFYWSRQIRKYTGSSVWEIHIESAGNIAKKKISVVGLFCFIFWSVFYIFCAYTAQSQDQTILRNLYSTKLRRYGDDFERISSFIYVMLLMWLTPFRLSGNTKFIQAMIEIDKIIKDIGDIIDYSKYARTTNIITGGQIFIYLVRMLCTWFPINNTNHPMPYEKVFQVVYSDAQAIILTSVYCHCNLMLLDRFKWINKVLEDIKLRSSWEYKVFTRGTMSPNIIKVAQIQEKHICEKIKTCSRVYTMLYNICDVVNKGFGFAVLITLLHYFDYIILYLFYFMEATASGLFEDVKRYIDFLMYGFWEIAIALGIIFFILYFCESVMKEAKYTSVIVHEIINGDFCPEINNDAMQFSIQLLHEKPTFNVLGLFDLNYRLIQEGARSVFTYLVIVLQFATESSKDKSLI